MKKLFQIVLLTLFVTVLFSSCRKQKSSMTGWNYNDTKQGGFEVTDYQGQATGPNLVLVQGGTFTMGNVEQDVAYDYHSIPRRVTVSSFYIDETEVANVHYREYLYWLGRTFKADFPEIYRRAFPDSMVWREELALSLIHI